MSTKKNKETKKKSAPEPKVLGPTRGICFEASTLSGPIEEAIKHLQDIKDKLESEGKFDIKLDVEINEEHDYYDVTTCTIHTISKQYETEGMKKIRLKRNRRINARRKEREVWEAEQKEKKDKEEYERLKKKYEE